MESENSYAGALRSRLHGLSYARLRSSFSACRKSAPSERLGGSDERDDNAASSVTKLDLRCRVHALPQDDGTGKKGRDEKGKRENARGKTWSRWGDNLTICGRVWLGRPVCWTDSTLNSVGKREKDQARCGGDAHNFVAGR